MLRLLIGTDWTANRRQILERIRRDVEMRLPGRILMVPELISHETERRLCAAAGDTASRYAEVLSFTRLAHRVEQSASAAAQPCLDNGGRVVAMASAARQLHSRLKAYASVETKPEFLTALIDGIDEFKRCCITAEDLKTAAAATEGSLSQKLEELSLLMESYDAVCARGKRDPRDRETMLLEQLEDGDFAANHVFYIDGFPDFTRQHMAILEHLIRCSPEVTVSVNCDCVDSKLLAFEKAGKTARELMECANRAGVQVMVEVVPHQNSPISIVREKLYQGAIHKAEAKDVLRVFRAESTYDETLAAAQYVQELVRCGCRYRDIAIVCSDMGVYQGLISLVFHRMGIPVYQAGTEDILQKSVVATVLNALDAALSGFEQKSMFKYLRSPLSPLEPDVCDQVENYAVIWGIRGSKWTQPWENHPEGLSGIWNDHARQHSRMLNEAVTRAVTPLVKLRQNFLSAVDLSAQVMAVYEYLEDISLARRLHRMAKELDEADDKRSAQILNQLWEILLAALEQMYDVLGQTRWEAEHFTRLLRLLLSQYDVGTIPPVLDAVQVGPVSAMRCHQQKHLIVLGAQEGSLPGYSGSEGILTDQERVALRNLGVPLTGGAVEGVQAEFAEIYGVFCGAEESIRVYCSDEQPSFIFRRLAQLAGGEERVDVSSGYALVSREEAGAWLAARNEAVLAYKLGASDVYDEICARRAYELGKISRENIEALYGQTLNLSASQIDRQAECRLSYFLKYGLRAQERKEAVVDPAEFGTYVHAVLENTAREIRDKGGFHQVSLEETLDIAHRHAEDYAKERFGSIDSQRITYLFYRNARELDMVVEELWNELSASLFAPETFELGFGAEEGLPPIAIPNSGMNAIVRGFIDRMDTWKSGPTTYYRVVDYKTGKKDFDYCDVYNGVGLQMLLYLFALKNSGEVSLGERPVPAGVQYFPARVSYLSTDGIVDEAELKQLRQKDWKRRGLLLHDEQVLEAMEPGEDKSRLCCTYKKDGTITGDLADREQLKQLEAYLYQILASMVEDIASGNVEPNPYTRGSSHSACAFCPYGAICHEDTVEGRRNYKTMTSQQFWDGIGKELNRHGR